MSGRLTRIAAATIASTFLLVPLSGCTSNTKVCTPAGCDISLSGKGSSTTIGTNEVEVKLHEVTDGAARFTLGQAGEMTCEQGQTKELSDATVTCKEVGKDKLKLRIDFKK